MCVFFSCPLPVPPFPSFQSRRARFLHAGSEYRLHARRGGVRGRGGSGNQRADASLLRRQPHPPESFRQGGVCGPSDPEIRASWWPWRGVLMHRAGRSADADRQTDRRQSGGGRIDAAGGHRRDPRLGHGEPEGTQRAGRAQRDVFGRHDRSDSVGRDHQRVRRRLIGGSVRRRSRWIAAARRPAS